MIASAVIGLALVVRISVGAFFAISGAHKLFDPVVRERVKGLFNRLGVGHLWIAVAVGELLGGLGVATGTLTPLAAAGLIVILIGAIRLDVWEADVASKHPRDAFDWFAKTVNCSEVLMVLMLLQIAISPEVFGVDTIVAGLLPLR